MKLGNLKAVRLMRLMRLLRASVGPLVTFEMCQLAIWGAHRAMVRPSLLISGGHDWSRVVVGEFEGVGEG